MIYKYYLWITPFICFILGYWIMGSVFSIKTIQVPRVVGLPIHEGIDVLSQKKLNVRILAKKEDADLPVGTILRQTPSPLTSVKPHHSIFLVTSKKPPTPMTPDLTNKPLSMVKNILQEQNIKFQVHPVLSSLPRDTCVGQCPQPGKAMPLKKIIVYTSKNEKTMHIFPNCLGDSLVDVLDFLSLHGLTANVNYLGSQTNLGAHRYTVIDQKPLPGTLINLDQPSAIQLLVKR